ncbi:MAG: S8 family peptidase [Dokdonella sp.]|uniref:S8 family peptidase n=1 Tax=Dokdonella sp. TaxID=2291710 RepID=UPI003F7E7A0F
MLARSSWMTAPLPGLTAAFAALLAFVAPGAHALERPPGDAADSARMIVVAIADRADPAPSAGATPRGYAGLPDYAGGSERTRAAARRIADDYALREVSAWTIDALHLRCMLYELPAGSDRAAALARMRGDRRVSLAQPLQEFTTYSTAPAATAAPVPPASAGAPYNDPYVGLQQGFSRIGAAAAQRWASGAKIEVAVVHTGADAAQPDLAGRVVAQRDFATRASEPAERDRHGTEVAGVIAAVANNGVGIVGVAPGTHIRALRACWPVEVGGSAARCDTFTLAQALGAAISSGARVINLSLGGPSDPLLEQLVAKAIERGIVVVGAVPPDARMDGFPVDVDGVVAVRSSDSPAVSRPALAAPGRDILTLEPGGHYDYASGSSLATAHVTGAVALLLEIDPRLDAKALFALLDGSSRSADASIDACAAVRKLARKTGNCDSTTTATGLAHAKL